MWQIGYCVAPFIVQTKIELLVKCNDNSSAEFWRYLLQRRNKEDADLSSLTGKTIFHNYYQMDFLRMMLVIMFKLLVHLYL